MPYITKVYYRSTYNGVAVASDTDLDRLIARASEDIDAITNDNIVLNGYDNYTTYIKNKIMLACAKQVELYAYSGYESSTFANSGSLSIGNFSTSNVNTKASEKYSKEAISLLASVGLIQRGVDYVLYTQECLNT